MMLFSAKNLWQMARFAPEGSGGILPAASDLAKDLATEILNYAGEAALEINKVSDSVITGFKGLTAAISYETTYQEAIAQGYSPGAAELKATLATSGGMVGGALGTTTISGPVTSDASVILRGLTGNARLGFSPLGIFGINTTSLGGVLGRAVPFVGTAGALLGAYSASQAPHCTPII